MTKHGALAAYEERAFNIQQQALDVQRAMGSPLFAIEELDRLIGMAEELKFDLTAYVENESPESTPCSRCSGTGLIRYSVYPVVRIPCPDCSAESPHGELLDDATLRALAHTKNGMRGGAE